MRKSSSRSPPSMAVSRIVAFASVTVPSAPVFAVLPRHCLCHNPEHQLQITSDKSSQFSHRLSPRFLHWHRLAMLSWNLIHTNLKFQVMYIVHDYDIVQMCVIFFLMQKMFTSQHFLSGTDTGFLIGTLEHSVLGTWKHSFFGTCVMSRYCVSCLYHTTLRDCIVSSVMRNC